MKSRQAHSLQFDELPADYASLVRLLPPRPIHDRHDLHNIEEVVFAMAGHELTADQEDYLQLMSDLLLKYEQDGDLEVSGDQPPAERLKYLLEQSQTTPEQLRAILDVSQPMASMILNGRRELSKANIRRLAAHFSVDAGYFL